MRNDEWCGGWVEMAVNRSLGPAPGLRKRAIRSPGAAPPVQNAANRCLGPAPGLRKRANRCPGAAPPVRNAVNRSLGPAPGLRKRVNRCPGDAPDLQKRAERGGRQGETNGGTVLVRQSPKRLLRAGGAARLLAETKDAKESSAALCPGLVGQNFVVLSGS
jgi:hypothetical protein